MSTSVRHTHSAFDEEHVLHVLRHYLPSQGPLKDFVHHNTLHAFQNMKFYDAIFKASKIFGYQSTFSLTEYRRLYEIQRIQSDVLERTIRERKGEAEFDLWKQKVLFQEYDWSNAPRVGRIRHEWKRLYPIDLDNSIQPLLFRIINSYLDQGIAMTAFPFEQAGLLNAIRQLEKQSMTSFFKTKKAQNLLHDATSTISSLLKILVGKEALFEEYIYDQQFAHRGWSGMVAVIEEKPEALLYPKKVSLHDIIMLELLLEIDALEYILGATWKPLGEVTPLDPIDILADAPTTELQEVLKIWHDAFEWSYYDKILAGILIGADKRVEEEKVSKKSFQALFCIDERECSFRRHLETSDPQCETLGAPGFFGIEFYFHPAHAKFYEKLCPVPVTPKYLILEEERCAEQKRQEERIYAEHSNTFVRGFFSSYILGIPALAKLFTHIFRPTRSRLMADSFSHMDTEAKLSIVHTGEFDKERGLQVGFTEIEMADRVERLLRGIGLTSDFATIVYIVGHGASSANNPYYGAYECGACSGRPGSVNARVLAFIANYAPVRKILAERGILIPEETQFIGVLHDTTSDQIAYFDENDLSEENRENHKRNMEKFEKALDFNAKERSRRFMSIDTTQSLKKVREAIKKRAVSYFEPRPEFGHGTNALCIVAKRELTKNIFLDRRAFLNSYDYSTDPEGKLLLGVITPLAVVCGGINLEYYFSRIDNSKLGAGTKLPHNVMGLIGVANSSDGDLRVGLPLQTVEVHDPVRLMMIVEQDPSVVLKVISSSEALYEWFINEWIHLTVLHPVEKRFYEFRSGEFVPYTPLTTAVESVDDVLDMVEHSQKMKTNYILDATKENIPVHIITK